MNSSIRENPWRCSGTIFSGRLNGKGKFEDATLARCTFCPYLAIALFNELFAKDQAQAGTLFIGGTLGREVVVDGEEVFEMLLLNTLARV